MINQILIARKARGYLKISRLDRNIVNWFLNHYICVQRIGNEYELRVTDRKEDATCKEVTASWSSVLIPIRDSFMPPGLYVMIPSSERTFVLRKCENDKCVQ